MTSELCSLIENIKLAADLSQDGIAISDNNGKLLYVNDRLASEIGYSVVELIGNPREILLDIKTAVDVPISETSKNFDEFEIVKISSPRIDVTFAYRAEKQLLNCNDKKIGLLESFRFSQPPSINKNVLNILYEIGQLPLGTKDLKELFSEIQLLISSVIYAKNFYIYLRNTNNKLDLVYYTEAEKRENRHLTEIEDLIKITIEKDTPQLFNQTEIKELVNSGQIRNDSKIPVYAMCVPLKIKETIIGAIGTQIFNNSYNYSKTDLQLLSYASNQIAIAVEEARINRTLNNTLDDIINIIEAMPFGIVLVSKNKKIELINDTALKLLDVSLNDPLEKINKELFTETPEGQTLLDPTETSQTVEIQTTNRTGKHQSLLKSTRQISFNNKDVFLETFFDITELKKAHELINRLSQTVYQSTNAIIITDSNGIIEFVNPHFSTITGYSSEEILEKHISFIQSPLNDDSVFKEQWEIVNSGNQWEDKLYGQTKSGEVYYQKTRVSPIINNEGKMTHFLFVIEDISEQIRTEEELKEYLEEIQYNKDILEDNTSQLAIVNAKLAESEVLLREEIASKDKFFSIISHDLKSPLSGLLGLSQMLIEDYDEFSNEERKEYITMLNRSAVKMHELLESLLHWARAQSGRLECVFENVYLQPMVDDLSTIYEENANKKKIKLVCDVCNNHSVYADKNVVNTILRNLIANAIKFTHPGGEIHIFSEYCNDLITVSVSDSGIGMSMEDQNKLFKIDVHHTTQGTNKEQGTGLGLILCKELVEKINGNIWVTSELGVGSTFSFTIPIAKQVVA